MKKFLLVIGLVIAAICIYILSIIFAPVPSLDSSLSKLKAQGIPTTLEELIPFELPDSENGALIYKEAFRILDTFEQKYSVGEKHSRKYKDDWKYLIGREEYLNAPADKKKEIGQIVMNDPDLNKIYSLVNKASRMKCQFHKRAEYKKGFVMETGEFGQARNCARLLSVKACIESELKLHDEAVNSSSLILRISSSFENEPSIIAQLVREAICLIGLDTLRSNDAVFDAKDAINENCLDVLSKTNNRSAVENGFKGEPILAYYTCADLLNNSKANQFDSLKAIGILAEKPSLYSIHFYLLGCFNPRKLINEQMIYYFDEMSKAYVVLKMPYHEGSIILKDLIDKMASGRGKEMILVNLIYPGVDRYYTRSEEIGAYIDIASLGVANRLYKSKHGRFADSLGQLSPGILPSVPKDPFSGNDYVYKKEGDGFIIYSLGKNMKDDNGKFEKMGTKGDFDISWRDSGK
ncbi:MAG: hypothetical protein WC481_02625 [Candidatus Omnitrophota bacterium]